MIFIQGIAAEGWEELQEFRTTRWMSHREEFLD